jgi:phosphoglycerate dehydrogenase-like enzyme
MKKHNILFISHRGERHQQAAIDAAPDIFEITMRRSPSKDEIISLLPDKEFLISERTGPIDEEIIAAGKDLRLIQRLGSQTYDIDLDAAGKAGIPVCYWPVRTCVMVAEHLVMQMLGLAKRLRENMKITTDAGDWGMEPKLCDEDIFAYNWSKRENLLGLYESTVGIVGFGEIGTELARRLQNYECTVLYNKRSRLPGFFESELEIQYTDLDNLLARSDFVCMLLPYFEETKKIVNAEFINKMKDGACLVSCGGSGVLDEDALVDALHSQKLYGLATDTFVYEPVHPDNPLLPLARQEDTNIILTPHTAAGTTAANVNEREQDYINLLNLLNDKPLRFRLT